jgi:Ricin-type beta-trefoil lectin domain
VSESTPEQPEEPKRPDVARAFTASVRQSGEKRSPSSYLLTAGLAIVLAGAVALGVGAIVFHHRAPAKTLNAADRRRPPAGGVSSAPPVNPATPSRPVAGGPVGAPGTPGHPAAKSPGKSADGKGSPQKKSGNGSTGSSGSGVRAEAAVVTHSIVSYASNRCVDVGGGHASGSPLQIWDCTGASWQRWSFENGTIRSMGMCMTMAGGASNGTPIQLATCNGGAAQRFKLNGGRDIVHSGTSECVDVKDQKTGNGTRLQLWKCSGTNNQKWRTG